MILRCWHIQTAYACLTCSRELGNRYRMRWLIILKVESHILSRVICPRFGSELQMWVCIRECSWCSLLVASVRDVYYTAKHDESTQSTSKFSFLISTWTDSLEYQAPTRSRGNSKLACDLRPWRHCPAIQLLFSSVSKIYMIYRLRHSNTNTYNYSMKKKRIKMSNTHLTQFWNLIHCQVLDRCRHKQIWNQDTTNTKGPVIIESPRAEKRVSTGVRKEQLSFCRHYVSSLVFVDLTRSANCEMKIQTVAIQYYRHSMP